MASIPTQTQAGQATSWETALQIPVFPSGEEIYDAIMSAIEPELTTAQLPLLKQKYAGETREQSVTRKARYQAAFDEYAKRYAVFSNTLTATVHDFQKLAISTAESSVKQREQGQLQSLEQSMDAA